MKTAFVYHRCACVEQNNEDPLKNQREATKELAKKYEAEIIASYEDAGVSGLMMERSWTYKNVVRFKEFKA